MKERIKKIRKELNLTQQEFADRIGVKRNSYANYETGRNTPIDAIILSVCREFNVNEEWLREGKGEMFVQRTRNQTITDFVDDLIEEPQSFKSRLVEGLSKLDMSDWEDIERIVTKILEKGSSGEGPLEKSETPEAPGLRQQEPQPLREMPQKISPPTSNRSIPSDEMSIDEKVEDYRRQLELQEKVGAELPALQRNA